MATITSPARGAALSGGRAPSQSITEGERTVSHISETLGRPGDTRVSETVVLGGSSAAAASRCSGGGGGGDGGAVSSPVLSDEQQHIAELVRQGRNVFFTG